MSKGTSVVWKKAKCRVCKKVFNFRVEHCSDTEGGQCNGCSLEVRAWLVKNASGDARTYMGKQ